MTMDKLMRYEWNRYGSFETFPDTSPAMPCRLATAGFFFTGKEDEVKCFSCGVTHKSWRIQDSPFTLHRKFSPNCEFVRGHETNNVAIHGDESCKQLFETEQRMNRRQDTRNSTSDVTTTANVDTSAQTVVTKTTTTSAQSASLSPTRTTLTSYLPPTSALVTSAKPRAKEGQTKLQNSDPLGICREIAKHPDYTVKAVRISSFKGWPATISQTPEELATAGFFYAGYGDCVRCFFCSGGLRHWDYGDEPWVEHARWFPKCAYVLQCNGVEFVQRHQELLETMNWDQSASTCGNKDSLNKSSTCNGKGEMKQNGNLTKTENDPIESAAALSVLEIGFSREKVDKAISKYKREKGHTAFSSSDLLHILFQDKDSGNDEVTNGDKGEHHDEEPSEKPNKLGHKKSEYAKQDTDREETKNSGINDSQTKTNADLQTTMDVTSISEENQRLKDQVTCKICMDKDACIVFIPCGHMVACPQCAHALRKCAICRTPIRGTVRAVTMRP